jgi:hypothetical protein
MFLRDVSLCEHACDLTAHAAHNTSDVPPRLSTDFFT